MKVKVLVILLLIAGVAVGGYLYNKYRIAPSVEFSALDINDLNGNPVPMSNLKGKKVFVNFFGTWCGPCLKEFPILERTQDLLANDDYVFVCVSDEPTARLRAFRQRVNARILVLHSNRKLKDMGINTIPTNYVLNTEGKVAFKQVGEITSTPAQLAEQLRGLMN